jgi:hypothetical protein
LRQNGALSTCGNDIRGCIVSVEPRSSLPALTTPATCGNMPPINRSTPVIGHAKNAARGHRDQLP